MTAAEPLSGKARADAAWASYQAHIDRTLAAAAAAAACSGSERPDPRDVSAPARATMRVGAVHRREILRAVNTAAAAAGLRPAAERALRPRSLVPGARAECDLPPRWLQAPHAAAAQAWPAVIDVAVCASDNEQARRQTLADTIASVCEVAAHGGHRVRELVGFGPLSEARWPAIRARGPLSGGLARRLSDTAGGDFCGHPMRWFERMFLRVLMDAFDCGVPLNISAVCMIESGCCAGVVLRDPELGLPSLSMNLLAAPAGTPGTLIASAAEVVLFANAVPAATMEHAWLLEHIRHDAAEQIQQTTTRPRQI